MIVDIVLFECFQECKELIEELNNKCIIKEKNIFKIKYTIKILSFEEITSILCKYNDKIDIKLHCYEKQDITLFISCKDDCINLGNQVE